MLMRDRNRQPSRVEKHPNIKFEEFQTNKSTSGTTNLAVEIENKVEMATLNAVERLDINIFFCCNYYDRQVEFIKPRKQIVKLHDGKAVSIVRNPGGSGRNAAPLLEAQKFPMGTERASTKIKVTQPALLKSGTQNFVTVQTDRQGLIVVEPNKKLFD